MKKSNGKVDLRTKRLSKHNKMWDENKTAITGSIAAKTAISSSKNFMAPKKKQKPVNENLKYPVVFEADTDWIESPFGKEDSDFRRVLTFPTKTNKKLIDQTVLYIKENDNPGDNTRASNWLVWTEDENPMIVHLKTSK